MYPKITAFQIIKLSGVGAAVNPSLLSASRLFCDINIILLIRKYDKQTIVLLPFEVSHQSASTWCGHKT